MDDNAKLKVCIQFIRRKYYAAGVYNIAGIQQESANAYAEAGDSVTITSQTFEGAVASGQLTFDKWLLIAACESLLLEVDPTNTPDSAPSGGTPDYSYRPVAT